MLGRPYELDGIVVAGDQRGGTLGYPTANLSLEPQLACPAYGIYAGQALEHRAAVSVGTNPHYGGTERRIEPYLLDFDGDLYGQRLVVELWERLRDEAAFATEEELVAQIARDVEQTRAAQPPVVRLTRLRERCPRWAGGRARSGVCAPETREWASDGGTCRVSRREDGRRAGPFGCARRKPASGRPDGGTCRVSRREDGRRRARSGVCAGNPRVGVRTAGRAG